MKLKQRILAAAATVAILCAAGCKIERKASSGTQPAPASPPVPSAAALAPISLADLDAVGKAGRAYRLALVVKTRNNPFFDPMIKAAEEEAKAAGCTIEVQAPPQESDKELQFSMVENLTAKGIDAILIAPADSKGIVPALKKAAQKGILVVNVDNRIDRETATAASLAVGGYVGANNEEGGRMAGDALVSALGGKGKAAILEGIRGADNAEARRRGFESAASGKLEIISRESADWDTQKAYAKFQSVLAAHPDLQGVFCANDKMALGALKAIEESSRKSKIAVVGFDNIADVRPYLTSGAMYGTIEQHPDLMGKYGVRMAVGVLDGKVKRRSEFLVPLELVRK